MESSTLFQTLRNFNLRIGNSFLETAQDLLDADPHYAQDPEFQQLMQRLFELARGRSDLFSQLQAAVRDGTAREKFPVGTLIPDVWTDCNTGEQYDMPMRIVDYRRVKLANCFQRAAILIRQHASPFTLQFDGPETSDVSNNRHLHGCNRYSQSSVQQYLNSNRLDGWWVPLHGHDAPPDDTDIARAGYLCGCSAQLLNVVTPIQLTVPYDYCNTCDMIEAKFFLPSIENLGVLPGDINEEYSQPATKERFSSEVWEYYRECPTLGNLPCPQRTFPDLHSGSAQGVLTRSAYRGRAHAIWRVCTDGSVRYGNACHARAYAPACAVA